MRHDCTRDWMGVTVIARRRDNRTVGMTRVKTVRADSENVRGVGPETPKEGRQECVHWWCRGDWRVRSTPDQGIEEIQRRLVSENNDSLDSM
eukprot:48575-Eustigmatos_ZCMA.PRE.1